MIQTHQMKSKIIIALGIICMSIIAGCGLTSKPTKVDVENSIQKTFENSVETSGLEIINEKVDEDKDSKVCSVSFNATIRFKDSTMSYPGRPGYAINDKYNIQAGFIVFMWNPTSKTWDGGTCSFVTPMKKISN